MRAFNWKLELLIDCIQIIDNKLAIFGPGKMENKTLPKRKLNLSRIKAKIIKVDDAYPSDCQIKTNSVSGDYEYNID